MGLFRGYEGVIWRIIGGLYGDNGLSRMKPKWETTTL